MTWHGHKRGGGEKKNHLIRKKKQTMLLLEVEAKVSLRFCSASLMSCLFLFLFFFFLKKKKGKVVFISLFVCLFVYL
jgi:hypothetical protein